MEKASIDTSSICLLLMSTLLLYLSNPCIISALCVWTLQVVSQYFETTKMLNTSAVNFLLVSSILWILIGITPHWS